MRAQKTQLFKTLSISILFLGFFITPGIVNAQEGTKQFMPNSNDRLWLEFKYFNGNNFGLYNCNEKERINIRLNSGEKVFFGMNMNTTLNYGGDVLTDASRVRFRVRRPSGTIIYAEKIMNTLTAADGLISTYNQAVAGPNGAILNGTTISGGYNPLTFTADETGDYYIEFTETSFTYNRFALQYFDVTVTDATNHVKTNPGEPNKSSGRLWSREWSFTTTAYDNYPVNANFFVFTSDEFINKVNFRMYPFSFTFVVNSYGVTTYTESNYIKRTQSQEGDQTAGGAIAEYRVFLNDPDRSVWPNTTLAPPKAKVWAEGALLMDYNYNRNPLYLPIDHSQIVMEKNMPSCPYEDVTIFKIESNIDGYTAILIDVDKNGEYSSSGSDRVIYRNMKKGLNYVLWNFKTDAGATVAVGNYNASATFLGRGPAHFPLNDVEQMDGITTSSIRPFIKLKTTNYWDDSQISNWGDPDGLMDETQRKQLVVDNDVPRTWSWRNLSTAHNGNLNTLNTWFNAIDLGYSSMGLIVQESATKCVDGLAPWVGDIYKEGPRNTDLVFTTADFTYKFFDPQEIALSSIQVLSLPAQGTLKLSGANIVVNQIIAAANLPNITYTPASNWSGKVNFEWKASNGTRWSNNQEKVYLIINTPPGITPITDQLLCTNTPTLPIPFTVSDTDGDINALTITGFSADPTFVPNTGVVIGGSGANRTVTVTPVANKSGMAIIYLMVDDGLSQVIEEFTVYVSPDLQFSGDTTVCVNQGLYLVAQENGATSYAWKYNGTTVSGGTSKTLDKAWGAFSAGNWSLTVVKGSCTSTRNFTVSISPLTTFSGDVNVCIGENISLSATEVNASYIWRKGATQVSTSKIYSIPSAALSDAATNYTLYVNKDGCTNTSSQFAISVVNSPNTGLAVSGNTVDPDKNGSITINTAQNGIVYNVYQVNNLVATGNGTGTNLTISIPSTYLAIGDNSFIIKANNGNCEVNLTNSAIIHVNTPGITVSAASANTTEAGGIATFTIRLNTEPSANVSIALSSSDISEGTVSPASLTFTSANYGANQTVTITGVDDNIIDGNIVYSIITAAASSADANYNGMNASDITVTNTDNDIAGVNVSPVSGLITTEAGGTASFSIVLTCQPTANVSINISSNDTGEGTVSTSMISFTSGNWNIPQSVTVTGVNDNIDDDNQIYTINTSTTSSTDVNFNGLSVSDVSATNTDNDVAGITVTPTSGLISTEAGGQATFTIVLNSEPTANVTIGISSSNTSEGTVSTSSITFTSSNWSTAQTITITGINDFVDDDNVNYSIITAQATGSDGIYNIINPSDVSVINTDDDTAGITVTPTSGLTTTESGGTASFTIRLNSQPTANVTIDISSSNTAEGIVSTSSLVFTTGNWGTAQTIIITGVNDDVDDGNANYSIITAQAASSDPRYSTINPSDVSVTNTDDDVAGVTVNPTSIGTTEAGGTGTFSLVLTSKPLADVTISFTGVNATEGSINKTNVVFSTLNWNIAQVVTVTGIDDVVADGNISYTIVTTASSTYPLYNGISVADVLVTNADNDVAGISVSPITLTTTEGGSNTFTIALNTQPTADVTINISSSDVSEGTVSPSTITFTNSNWAVKTITVTGVNDDIDDNDITYSVQTSNTISTDGNYNNKPVDDVSVTNIDDDIAGITITPTSGLITTEAGGTATFTVRLNSQPTANVTIGISSSNTSEGTVSPSSLTFTSSDWNTNQTVTITGINDNVDDDDVNYSIITSQVASADSKYSVINPSDVSITNTDNDIAGIIVTPTNGLVTTEAGGTVTFTVRLNSQPTANVTVGISSSNTSEGTVSPSSLTFTSSDWNTNQTVTITGVNDNVDDDDVNYSIITSQAASTDSKYSVINPSDVSVTNTDNDIAGIIVTPTNGLVTTEAGGTATFTICLNSQPTASVTIGISSSNTSEGAVSPSSIAFNAGDWNSPKTVTVTGVDDFLVDGNISYSIVTAQAVSADSKYSIINPSNVAVTNNDNDLAGMTVNPTTGLTTTEAGGTSTFTVRLNSQPTANVTIGISSSNTAEGIVSPSSLTFSSSDWNSNKTVTIAGVNDFVDDGNTSYTIVTAAATSTDANYNGLNAMDVPVTNIDNDVFGIIVSPTAGLYTREDGLQTSFTIRLNSQPTANVTIGISSSDIAEGTIDKSSVLFTPATWNINQTITITGVNDNVDDGDIAYSIITQAATSTDPLYNNVDAQNVSVTNQNDDIAGITLNSSTISINEGGIANTFTIVLNTEPTQNVTIGLSSNNTNKGTVSAASITFTPINWNSPQIISVTPVDNLIDDGDITFTVITDPATSLDDNYENKNASDLTVTSIDNDVKGINVTSVTGNTSETLTSSTFTIALNSEPTSDVTIGISSDDTGEGTVSPASVTFNSSNWNLPLTVTITGVDDAIADGNQTYHIVIAAASSSDANYNGVDADDITMVNSDNDSPGVTVFGITGLITTEAGGTATITVRLNSQPTADVKIDISSSDNTEGIVDIPSVTFTSANWNIQQTITITGIDDLIPDGDIPYTIQLANAVSTDPGYNNVDVQDVTVTNKDDVGPRATSDAASTDEDSEINIAVLANDKGLDNGGLTLSITQQPSHGSLIIEANNTITYKPNGLFNGNDTFKYSVCDGTSSCDEAIVTVTVTWKDDLPVAVPDARGTSKNTPVNLDVLFNDYGMEDGGIVVAIDEAATHGTAVRNADNTITFTPTAGYIGLATLVYKITDTDADSDTARVTINVREINTVPNAIDDAASTIKNNLVEISVLANDFGLNDGFGRLSTYLNPAHGTVTINAARTITYTPATNYIGNDSFRYLLEDVDGDYDIATVTIAVTEKLNSIPAAKPDRRGTNYQTPVTVDVLTNDTGLEDGVKSVTISSLPVNGGVVVNGDHSVTYTPNNGFSGIETFGYQVSDNDDDRSTATVTITVLPDGVTNHTPAAVDDAATTAVNTPVGVSVLANDTGLEDGFGGLSIHRAPLHGTAAVNADRTITYTPSNLFIGGDSFQYWVEDVHGDYGIATVTITVADKPNHVPLANPDRRGAEYETPITVDVLANDTGLEDVPVVVTVTTAPNPTEGSAAVSGANVIFTPATGYSGTSIFSYTVTDKDNESSTATVTITVLPDGVTNHTPAAVDDAATTAVNTPVGVSVLANDTGLEDGFGGLSIHRAPQHGTAAVNADRTITYTPSNLFIGGDSFQYWVEDVHGDYGIATVTITVADKPNHVPVANPDRRGASFNTPVTVNVLINDTGLEDEPIVVSLETLPNATEGTVVVNIDNTITFTPFTDYIGFSSFKYRVTDKDNESDDATVTINVKSGVNYVPVALDDVATTIENRNVSINVLANDTHLDDGIENVIIHRFPKFGTVVVNANYTVTYTPSPWFVGTDDFDYMVSDVDGDYGIAKVSITVNPIVNSYPVANDDSRGTSKNVSVKVNVLINDTGLDDGGLALTIPMNPSNGTVVVNLDNTITYSPNTDYLGVDHFTYQVCDINNDCSAATVTINVKENNFEPQAQDDIFFTKVNTSGIFNVLDNDTGLDDGGIRVELLNQVIAGQVIVNSDNTITYTPLTGFEGVDNFAYKVTDIDGDYDIAQVSVVVTSGAIPGFIVTPTSVATSEEGTNALISVSLKSAPASNVTIKMISTDDTEGSVSPATLTFTPANWNVAQTFTVTGVNDFIIDGPVVYSIIASVDDANSDDNFDPLFDQVVSVTNSDNDAAGFTLSKTTANTSEAGATDNFAIVLNAQPNSSVEISIFSEDLTEGTVSPTTLTYTAANWNTPQTVTVLGVSDILIDGSITYNVSVSVVDVNSDDNFDLIADQIVTITNADNNLPVANNDENSINKGELNIAGNLLDNDTDTDNDILTVSEINSSSSITTISGNYGSLSCIISGEYTYTLDNSNDAVNKLNNNQTLTETFSYNVTDGKGGSCIASLAITINGYTDLDNIFIPKGFSPDGDGISDTFIIPGIENYPDNELTVYNRWGSKVFNKKHYKDDWDGYSDSSNGKLPVGTYFYILKANGKTFSGYVYLKY